MAPFAATAWGDGGLDKRRTFPSVSSGEHAGSGSNPEAPKEDVPAGAALDRAVVGEEAARNASSASSTSSSEPMVPSPRRVASLVFKTLGPQAPSKNSSSVSSQMSIAVAEASSSPSIHGSAAVAADLPLEFPPPDGAGTPRLGSGAVATAWGLAAARSERTLSKSE